MKFYYEQNYILFGIKLMANVKKKQLIFFFWVANVIKLTHL